MCVYKKNKVVAIGGGHGLGRILSALKDFGGNATGIVTTTDNGGSTGRIRECQGGIAWGDTRNCVNQLITEPSISSMMFEYRFRGAGELNGHNLGNLMLTALDNLSVRPLDAINLIRSMLKVDIYLIPMTEHPADLTALAIDGTQVMGETSVDEMTKPLRRLDIDPIVPATKEAVTAINEANCIILGPGSFLTSIMPPLLLSEITDAIEKNQTAKLIFIDNLSPEQGPAGMMNLEERLAWCERAVHGRRIDQVLTGSNTQDIDEKWNINTADLASANRDWRHDRQKLNKAICDLIQ
ncbi:uridine diphosphate-N-acetylglucosamine-binding protein YvcK [Vibrio sp.]|nr:uridine diphosphate-N-acetylglucosamine-binding protein YvcK [Vibrio sp.]